MVRNLRTHGLGAHIVDGPQGPAGIVKPGAVHMANMSGAVIIPLYTRANRAWYFNSWDRFFIPKPFADVVIRFGDTMTVGKLDRWQLEIKRKQLEDQMKRECGLSR